MSKKKLLHPVLWTAPLAANAANTTFELSTADANILDAYRLAMGGEVRILIYKPATYDSSTPYYETVLIDDAPTAGVFTVAAMTNEAQYTTANSAAIALNLIADGQMQEYGVEHWTPTKTTITMFKTIDAPNLKQSLFYYNYEDATVLRQQSILLDGNYYIAMQSKKYTGNVPLNLRYADLSSLTVINEVIPSTSWTGVNASFHNSDTGLCQVEFGGWNAGDSSGVTNISLINQLIVDSGFEDTADWDVSDAAHATDSSNEKSGTNCGKVTASAANGYVYQAITVTDETYYTCIFHGKATAGDSYKYQVVGVTTGKVYFESDVQTGTSYKEIRCQFKTTGDTSIQLRGICIGNGDIIYFDDWAMVPLIIKNIPTQIDYQV